MAKWHKRVSMPGKEKNYLNRSFLGFEPNLYGLIWKGKILHTMSLISFMRQQVFKSWMDNTDVASRFSFSFNIRHMEVIFVCIGLADASFWKKRAMGSLLDNDATQCTVPKQTLCLFLFTMTLNELEINPLKWLELCSSRNQTQVRLSHCFFA